MSSGQSFRVQPTPPAATWTDHGGTTHNSAQVIRQIDDLLARPGATPIGISFCSTVLRNPDAVRLASTPLSSPPPSTGTSAPAGDQTQCQQGPTASTGEGSDHAALVIGRKRAPGGGCLFLLRNSWGASCERYLSSRPGFECEESTGDIWVSQSVLADVIYGTYHFP